MENNPKRKGPAPKPEAEKRYLHSIYFTAAEWEALQDRARAKKKTTSPYIVDFLFGRD